MDPNQQPQEGERGLTSFLGNVVHNVTTAKPPSTPQIDADVAALDHAFKGVGTNEAEMIRVSHLFFPTGCMLIFLIFFYFSFFP